jgi:hypothetical protein
MRRIHRRRPRTAGSELVTAASRTRLSERFPSHRTIAGYDEQTPPPPASATAVSSASTRALGLDAEERERCGMRRSKPIATGTCKSPVETRSHA